jgi:competence protein ComEC
MMPERCRARFPPRLFLLTLCIYIPIWSATMPFASIYLPTPPTLWLVLYFFILIGIPWWLKKNWQTLFSHNADDRAKPLWNKPLCASLGIASIWVIVWLVWPRFPESPSETLSVCVLDVGQGESIFIEFPNHQTMLIDGGGFYKNTPDVGKTILAPFLWNKGIGRINYITATHSDNDHISGLESLLAFFPVEHYLARREDILDDRLWKLRSTALQHKTELVAFETGKPLLIGDVSLLPLHPDITYANKHNPKGAEKNNTSLVLRLDYRTFNILLTGDMAEQAEQYLVDKGAPIQSDFLKAPHHGSKHSSTPAFIKAVAPRDVIFSSGYLNHFNHPNPEVLARYKSVGAKIHRTDRDGAVCITTDGLDHKIETHETL